MADEEQRYYDASDAVTGGPAGEPEDLPPPPVDATELEAKYLLGASFPASRDDVIAVARSNDAPSRVLDVLARLEDREYAHVTELIRHVEDMTGERREIV
jgi:hypothetical protein